MPLIWRPDVPSSEITPEGLYLRRREFLAGGAVAATGLAVGLAGCKPKASAPPEPPLPDLPGVKPGPFGTDEPRTPYKDITTYNNFYEFGTDKSDPAANAHRLKTRPWTVAFEGEIAKPQVIDVDALLGRFPLEERVYRLRCVEAWSMVVPWVGFPLADLLKRFEPTSKAKYVQFFTLADREQMPGIRYPVLEWPYREGLTIEEAVHPLTLATVGLYGKMLPNQSGAPLRVVIPWKYGFKGTKSVVRIHFTDKQPATSWNMAAPQEYGFYSNVNPKKDHPRWSQATERRLGGGLFSPRIPTQMFNGYGEQVAQLYTGLDLIKNY
jgi:methionine sulfoxide reductase catalytic subunit